MLMERPIPKTYRFGVLYFSWLVVLFFYSLVSLRSHKVKFIIL